MMLSWLITLTSALISTCSGVREINCLKGEKSCSGNDVHSIRLAREVICCPKSRHFRITHDCKCVEGPLTVTNSDLLSSLLGPSQPVGSRAVSRVHVVSSRVPGRTTHVHVTTHHAGSHPATGWLRRVTSWHHLTRDMLGWTGGESGNTLRPNRTSLFPFSRFPRLLNLDPELTLGARGGGRGGVKVSVRPQAPPPDVVVTARERTPSTRRSQPEAEAPPPSPATSHDGGRSLPPVVAAGARRPIDP